MKDDNNQNDFEELTEENTQSNLEPNTVVRIRLPRRNEIIGIVKQRLGGNRMEVKCTDNKTRNCRVPGRFQRKFWLRPNDLVIITPWPDNENKGDIVYQYHKNLYNHLRKLGVLKNLDEGF